MDRTLLFKLVGHLVFWTWNLWLLSIFTLGFGPVVMVELLISTWQGLIPLQITAFALSLMLVPGVAMIFGGWKLRAHGGHLLALLYGVELPLIFLLGVRVFAIHELTVPTTLALMCAGLGMVGLVRILTNGPREENPMAQIMLLVSQVAFALSGLWWGLITAIYSGGFVLKSLSNVPWMIRNGASSDGVFFFVLLCFVVFTLAVFLACPLVMAGVSLRSLQIVGRETARFWTRSTTGLIGWGALSALLVSFGLAGMQPQKSTFDRLRAVQTDADRRAILEDLPTIRHGLLGARLGPDRFLEADSQHVYDLYDDLGPLANGPAMLWHVLMVPFRYQALSDQQIRTTRGRETEDVMLATQAYADVFDADMRRAEADALIASARSTWSVTQAAADVFDIGEEKVWLAEQTIDATPHENGLTSITIHDVYENQTYQDAEIVIHFSLPEGAAVTGLSLNDTADRSTAFDQVVAPRGAAQEVYQREVQRRVDPALLEQVGPGQYRLRAYPVQARSRGEGWQAETAPPFHMWVDLVVPTVQRDGVWVTPMPRVSEVRNAYWTQDSKRAFATSWTPDVLAVGTPKGPLDAVVAGWKVTGRQASPTQRSQPVSVLVDGTYSMHAHRVAIADALSGLEAEIWCTQETRVVRCDGFDANTALFWGNTNLATQLAEWDGRMDRPLLVLTDKGSYGMTGDAPTDLPDARLPPTWLVHLDALPAAYDDWVLDGVQQSGGGVVRSVDEAMERLANPDLVDGWRFSLQRTDRADTEGASQAVAARQAIRLLDRRGGSSNQHLDAQHVLAKGASVVTPYSSMIVLVNDWQRKALENASKGEDRFDREQTDAEFENVSSVPEPSTWLLLLLGGGLLAHQTRRREVRAAQLL